MEMARVNIHGCSHQRIQDNDVDILTEVSTTNPNQLLKCLHSESPNDCYNGHTTSKDWEIMKKFVTSPIFYVNAIPHIGHLYSVTLCDVIHRFNLLKGYDSRFSTGTDEHGLKIQQAALQRNKDPLDWCNQISLTFKNLFDKANINYSTFIRTTDPLHVKTVHSLWSELDRKGYIYKDKHRGWYSISDETFVTQVMEHPTTQQMISKENGNPVEWSEELNYKFKLSAFKDRLKEWLIKEKGNQTKQVLDHLSSIQDISISRPSSRLQWGISVPQDSDQKVYVWLDALTNYLTVSHHNQTDSYWPASCHVIGKDILKFHAIYWPAFLMAADLPLPKKILSHAHFVMNGQKMSKSIGNVIDPVQLLTDYDIDVVRYYLIRDGGIQDDAEFSFQELNKRKEELANQLGNLLSRCTSKKVNPWQTIPSSPGNETTGYEQELIEQIEKLTNSFESVMEDYDFHTALSLIHHTMFATNRYVQSTQPWKLLKTNQLEKLKTVLYYSFETLRLLGTSLLPVMPTKANLLLKVLGNEQPQWNQFGLHQRFKTDKTDLKLPETIPILFPRD